MDIKLAHKIMQKLSIEHLTGMYNLLNVKADNYNPESWYGGVSHPITGEVLANNWQVQATIGELFSSITQHKLLCKEKFIVWTQGDNRPTYIHCKNGVGFVSNKEYDCYHLDKNEKHHHCKKSKGKLLSTGKYGLGVPYNIACVLWGREIIDNLPLKT